MAKSRHKSNKRGKTAASMGDKELYVKDEGTCYGYIEKCFGNGRFDIVCDDMKHRMGILRGNMRNRTWIATGDMVLCCIRDFEDSKVDIVHRYTSEDIIRLYRQNNMPQQIFDLYTSGTSERRAEDDVVAFMDDDDTNPDEVVDNI